jgi:hypothetical protein
MPETPPESSLKGELWAILVLYLALMVLPILFGVFFMT